MAEQHHRTLRFVDSMPRPLLIVFAVGGVVAVVASTLVLLRPPLPSVAVHERRPPPAGTSSHAIGLLAPAPVPSSRPTFAPPCDAVSSTSIVAGVGGIARLRGTLEKACIAAGGGVALELSEAVRGLAGATIRFAGFDKTGVESSLDFATKTIWVNIKFSRSSVDPREIVPVVLHEAYHLAHSDETITASAELGARRAELAACREFISQRDWPRSCDDARALASMPAARATELLVSAGYVA